MYLVGLPDNAVKESEQRIRAAFENSGERMSGRKVVVSLAPADLRKEGSGFDLPSKACPKWYRGMFLTAQLRG